MCIHEYAYKHIYKLIVTIVINFLQIAIREYSHKVLDNLWICNNGDVYLDRITQQKPKLPS
jgi:hypothetical protein